MLSTARRHFKSSDAKAYEDLVKAYADYEKNLSNFVVAIKKIRDYAYYNEVTPPPNMLANQVAKLRDDLGPLQKKSEEAFETFNRMLGEGALYLKDAKIQKIKEASRVLGEIRANANAIWFFPTDISEEDKTNHDLLIEMFDQYRTTRQKTQKVF